MKYQIHYPKSEKFSIKINNKVYKYKHNDIIEEELFFKYYPHIFKPRPDLVNIIKNNFNYELIETESKGWWIVKLGDKIVYPSNKSKCRKKEAEKFIKSQKEK